MDMPSVNSRDQAAIASTTTHPHPHAMGPKQGDKWAENQRAKVNQLPDDNPEKASLLATLDEHKGKGWTADEADKFESHLGLAQLGPLTYTPHGDEIKQTGDGIKDTSI